MKDKIKFENNEMKNNKVSECEMMIEQKKLRN